MDRMLCNNKYTWCFHKIVPSFIFTMQNYKELNIFLNYFIGYNPPTPPKGSGYHRYILAAFSHAEALNLEKITQRCGFNIDLFAKTQNLQPMPDANNMFKTITK